MPLPRISIVTPSYNQGQYIEETILSVLNQNYPNLEYIIIDGGSTDNTVGIIKKYADRLSYWVSEPDKGQSDAINKGLRKATGHIVAWLNSDDCYEPGALNEVAKQFGEHPQAGILLGGVKNVYEDGRQELYKNDFEPVDFMSRVAIHQPGAFWRRELNERLGYLDPSFYYLMDQELWVRLFFNAECVVTRQVLSRFRIHDLAKTGKNPVGLYLDFRRIISRLLNSVNDQSYKEKALSMGWYDNPDDIKYNLSIQLTPAQLRRIFANNTWNNILLEYRMGNIGRVNKLIFNSLGYGHGINKVLVLLKNNLGIGFIKHSMQAR